MPGPSPLTSGRTRPSSTTEHATMRGASRAALCTISAGALALIAEKLQAGSANRPTPCNYLRMDAQNEVVLPSEDELSLAVEVFRMLADPTRVGLLYLLLAGERPVGELAVALGKPAAGVSQHLAKLRMARLVQTRRQGTQVFYRIGSEHVSQLIQDAVFHAEHASPGLPRHHEGQATALTDLTARAAGETRR